MYKQLQPLHGAGNLVLKTQSEVLKEHRTNIRALHALQDQVYVWLSSRLCALVLVSVLSSSSAWAFRHT